MVCTALGCSVNVTPSSAAAAICRCTRRSSAALNTPACTPPTPCPWLGDAAGVNTPPPPPHPADAAPPPPPASLLFPLPLRLMSSFSLSFIAMPCSSPSLFLILSTLSCFIFRTAMRSLRCSTSSSSSRSTPVGSVAEPEPTPLLTSSRWKVTVGRMGRRRRGGAAGVEEDEEEEEVEQEVRG